MQFRTAASLLLLGATSIVSAPLVAQAISPPSQPNIELLTEIPALVIPNETADQGSSTAEPTQQISPPQSTNFLPQQTELIRNSDALHQNLAQLDLFDKTSTGYGTQVTRITSNSAYATTDGNARHNYSKRQVWNLDETLMDVGNKFVDANTYSIVRDIPLSSERVWSNTNPNLMYGMAFNGQLLNHFVVHNVHTAETRIIRDFQEYSRCFIGGGEGNLSNDDRYVLLNCQSAAGNTAVSFDIETNQIIGTLPLSASYDWGGFSHSGKYIVIANIRIPEQQSLFRYNKFLGDPLKITTFSGHADLGVDDNGEDVFVEISWDYVFYYNLATGERTNLNLSDPVDNIVGHGHISCRAILRPGWCYISSYSPDRLASVKISADDAVSETWGHYLSDWRGGGFRAQPQVSVSPSGRQIIFASNLLGTAEINAYIIAIE